MIFLYTLLLLLLGAVKWLVSRRAISLERKYSRVAAAVSKLVSNLTWKPGNSGRADLCASAKCTFELGAFVQKRDLLERKCYCWRGWADKLSRAVDAVRSWKGKKLPYTLGALDVWLTLALIDHFGFADIVRPGRLIETVLTWVGSL
ncbi:MAG: hypothetical protein HY040_18245 [Planctomycetes bacterium]|nr:hypothetical protein [Planctomycetota bacterium]